MSEKERRAAEDLVDWSMEVLVFNGHSPGPKKGRRDMKCRPEDMGPLWLEFRNRSDPPVEIINPDDFDDPSIMWPIRWGHVFLDEAFVCREMKSVPSKSLRGRARFIGKYNVEVSNWNYYGGDDFISGKEYASFRGGRWLEAGTLTWDGKTPISPGDTPVPMMMSLALLKRYEWGAGFRMDNSAEVILPVTPSGVLSLFKDRDKPEDRDRRAPLRHWVNEFLRLTPGGDFTTVRQHLRATTKLKWRGYDVTIYPSAFDVELNANLAAGR